MVREYNGGTHQHQNQNGSVTPKSATMMGVQRGEKEEEISPCRMMRRCKWLTKI